MLIRYGLLCAIVWRCCAETLPTIWEVGKHLGHVEIRHDVPEPSEFFEVYVHGSRAHPEEAEAKWKTLREPISPRSPAASKHPGGRPVLLKGAAKRMPAYDKWATDELLLENYASVKLDQVETEKVETRTKYPHDNWKMKKFLANYNKSEIYSTATPPQEMQKDLFLLPAFNCGGFLGRIRSSVMWFSSGGTQSVIHSDPGHNQYCQFAGSKRWALWHPSQHRMTADLGWVSAEEEAKQDPAFKDTYGAWYGKVNYNAMDVEMYPGWKDMEYYSMDMEPGDCALVPDHWIHHVESPRRQRSLAVHVWISAPGRFDEASCKRLEEAGVKLSDFIFRYSDCTMGYEDPDKRVKKTKCKLSKASRQLGAASREEL
eukprot:TRINITY_DN61619_c0_g1_i1.p1 TRINITY_DN61619_c0_g1~~TRINITY_DN61619_c0_g1_i1.p1  ORF type:complete len:372 (+),score=52.92 TRINITY_DN61619_c0_g1_i1:51-1166(+)